MNVRDLTYNDSNANAASSPVIKTWCERDCHHLFDRYSDFNEWLDNDEAQELRVRYKIDGLANPGKALFASDGEAYNQAFEEYRANRFCEVLGEESIKEVCGDSHWFERNQERFEQLMSYLINGEVVPFVGAGLSVDGGFPTWKKHLEQQGRTSGLNSSLSKSLLAKGQYEQIIEEIEAKGNRDVFIQELKDVFSKTGKITGTTLRLTELFRDTVITTNYDHLIEQAYDTGERGKIQIINNTNILDDREEGKVTIVKLHGDVRSSAHCILSKRQYNDAYGDGELDLTKPIPKLLSYFYKTSSLLFLGCSLNQDRTMQVFKAIKTEMGDMDRPSHFVLEGMPEDEEELRKRNAYLLSFGIIPIWFPKGRFEYIEQILKCARNELRYRGK